MRESPSWRRYLVYMVGGGLSALVTIGLRELFAALLPADDRFYFVLSIVLAYAVGIAMNFFFQKQITFRSNNASRSAFVRFVAVALVGLVLVAALSYVLRYPVGFERWFAPYGDTLAFAAAALATSLATYALNAWLVFGMEGERGLAAQD
ncbi:MAG: GtrA family protein [Chromatiales bacterium]|nr:GtrA family protein [Chromatiales bacterium]